jgi:hypothetical protein
MINISRLKCLLIGFLVLLAGCALNKSSPEYVLSEYLEAELHGRKSEAWEYLSKSDRDYYPIKEQDTQQEESPGKFKKVLYDNISFVIEDISVIEDRAEARVLITTPDFGVMFSDLYVSAFGSINQETMTKEEIDQIFADRYSREGLPMTTAEKTYKLIKEDDEWKISLDRKQKTIDLDTLEKFMP